MELWSCPPLEHTGRIDINIWATGHQSLADNKGGQRPCTILVDKLYGPLREHADVAHQRGVNTDNHSLFDQTKEGEKYCENIYYNQPHLMTVKEEYPLSHSATATVSTMKHDEMATTT